MAEKKHLRALLVYLLKNLAKTNGRTMTQNQNLCPSLRTIFKCFEAIGTSDQKFTMKLL